MTLASNVCVITVLWAAAGVLSLAPLPPEEWIAVIFFSMGWVTVRS